MKTLITFAAVVLTGVALHLLTPDRLPVGQTLVLSILTTTVTIIVVDLAWTLFRR